MNNESRRKFIKTATVFGGVLPLVGLPSGDAQAQYQTTSSRSRQKEACSISIQDQQVTIRAGILTRVLDIRSHQVITRNLSISGKALMTEPAAEFSLSFSRAVPDRQPAGIRLQADGSMKWADGSAVNNKGDNQPVSWDPVAMVNGRELSARFQLVTTEITHPREGHTRLQLRAAALNDPALQGVTLSFFYEVYEGYPVIRKWIEVINNGAHWLKIDRFTIDAVTIAPDFRTVTPLTPAEQGAESSIVAFSDTKYTHGVIVTSEVPSAVRTIGTSGSTGYSADYFEWVLGPSEHFATEPVFHFGFSGAAISTVSGVSTPLDRAVETPFKDFLRGCVGLRAAAADVPAPIWCSYTNFLDKLNDADMRQQADIAAAIGFETFQLDEGWAATPAPGGSEPGSTFPDFVATCNYIRSKGLQVGLWISCFRGSEAKDLKALPDGRSLPLFQNTKRGYGMSFSGPWRDYFANDLLYMRDKYGMTYVKVDLTNISKGDIAEAHESRTRKESLLRGLRGLLHMSERVGALAPDIWTQLTHELYWRTPGPPADIAVLKYACAFHTTPNTYKGAGNGSKRVSQDWPYDPLKMRAQLIDSCWEARQRYFGHRGLPLYSVEFYAAHTVNIKGSMTPQVQDRQVCSWLMGAPTVFAGDLSSLTKEQIGHYRKRFNLLKYLQQAYNIYQHFQYSGVPQPTETDWHWWGKLNGQGAGVVVVIRGSEGAAARAVNVPWAHAKSYRVTALFTGKKMGRYTGMQLRNGALNLALPAYGQELLELEVVN
ncbi:hypothetical protein [Niabella aurantiaca]|uniref:hypothetical protein n=1 Tax=Niabella aurantiaca TaxID=379900 RepID=UPI000370D4DE|nr:hypothetical protein [Niabella aurantiaca]